MEQATLQNRRSEHSRGRGCRPQAGTADARAGQEAAPPTPSGKGKGTGSHQSSPWLPPVSPWPELGVGKQQGAQRAQYFHLGEVDRFGGSPNKRQEGAA